jgi:hypothetical protein
MGFTFWQKISLFCHKNFFFGNQYHLENNVYEKKEILVKTQDINDKDMAPLGVTVSEVIAHPWWMKISSNLVFQERFWFIAFLMAVPCQSNPSRAFLVHCVPNGHSPSQGTIIGNTMNKKGLT